MLETGIQFPAPLKQGIYGVVRRIVFVETGDQSPATLHYPMLAREMDSHPCCNNSFFCKQLSDTDHSFSGNSCLWIVSSVYLAFPQDKSSPVNVLLNWIIVLTPLKQ